MLCIASARPHRRARALVHARRRRTPTFPTERSRTLDTSHLDARVRDGIPPHPRLTPRSRASRLLRPRARSRRLSTRPTPTDPIALAHRAFTAALARARVPARARARAEAFEPAGRSGSTAPGIYPSKIHTVEVHESRTVSLTHDAETSRTLEREESVGHLLVRTSLDQFPIL